MNTPRDNSPEAIQERYRQANLKAVYLQDPVIFDSLRDVLHLLKEVKRLREICQESFEATERTS